MLGTETNRVVRTQRRSTWAIVLVGIASASSIGLWVLGSGRQRAKTDDVDQRAQIAVLTQRIQQLEAEQGRQRVMSGLMLRASTSEMLPSEAPATKPSPTPPPPPPTARERYDDLEAKFAGEPVDRSWAGKTEAQMSDVIHHFKRADLIGVSCRSSMCRVEVEFPNREIRDEFEGEHVATPPFLNTHIWTQRFTKEDGSFRSVEIVSRDGPLPMLTAAREPR